MHNILCYSGGADSQAALDIAIKKYNDVEIVFCDTGLEFPETYETIEETAEFYQVDITVLKAVKTFEEYLESFNGLYPSRSLRWCTDRLKTRPLIKYLNSIRRSGESVLEIDGVRKDESRTRKKRLETEPRRNCKWDIFHIIFEMTKPEVIEYIKKYELPLNPLYEMGYSRTSCWFCPFKPMAENRLLKTSHPELFKQAETWAAKYGQRFNTVIEDIIF